MISFLREFWVFLKTRKKFWLLPIFVVLLAVGGLIAATQGTAIAPFIYTLF
jgi:drug/metabolite transporter superfamily protein YnfA